MMAWKDSLTPALSESIKMYKFTKSILIAILIGLFTYVFLKFLWPAFRNNVISEWYLVNIDLILKYVNALLLFMILSILTWILINRKNVKIIQKPPALVITITILIFLLNLISIAIKIDIR